MWEKGSIKDPWNYLINPILLVFLFLLNPVGPWSQKTLLLHFLQFYGHGKKRVRNFFSLHPEKNCWEFLFRFRCFVSGSENGIRIFKWLFKTIQGLDLGPLSKIINFLAQYKRKAAAWWLHTKPADHNKLATARNIFILF